MSKVLISAIGAGQPIIKKVPNGINERSIDAVMQDNVPFQIREYQKTEYRFSENGKGYVTSFVAAALATHLKIDKVILVGTEKSMWEEVYLYFAQNADVYIDDNFYTDLGTKVENYKHGMPNKVSENDLKKVSEVIDAYLKKLRSDAEGGSRCFLMDYGMKDEELIKNFKTFMNIADNLKEGDEVYLDITHSFRSIPIFMFVMLDFLETLKYKNIKLKSVYYGMLEVRREIGYSKIVDLKLLFTISKWIKATYDFINYGNGYLISELINDEETSEIIKNISDLINLNSLKNLRSNVDKLNNLLESKKAKIDTPEYLAFRYLLPYVEDFAKRFHGLSSNSEFQFRLAEWYYENKRYSSSYICLAEAIITKILELYKSSGVDVSITNKDDRKKAKKLFKNFANEPDGSPLKKLHCEFSEINSIRNLIAHAGFAEVRNVKEWNLGNHIKEIRKLLFTSNLPEEIKRLPGSMQLPENSS